MAKSKKSAPENHGTKVTPKELTIIKRLVKDRTPTAQIATEVGRSVAALRKVAFRAGVSLRKRATKTVTKRKAA